MKNIKFIALVVLMFSPVSAYADTLTSSPFSLLPAGKQILAGGGPPDLTLNDLKSLKGMATQTSSLSAESLKSDALNALNNKGAEISKSYLEKYFPTVELELDMMNGSNPTSSILIVAPLSDPSDSINTFFTQDSIYYSDNRTTVNLGVGYRRLMLDK